MDLKGQCAGIKLQSAVPTLKTINVRHFEIKKNPHSHTPCAIHNLLVIPLSAYEVEKPVFLGLAEKDPLALPAIIKPSTEKWCKNITVKSFNGGHWLLWDSKDDVNKELGAWLETLSPNV